MSKSDLKSLAVLMLIGFPCVGFPSTELPKEPASCQFQTSGSLPELIKQPHVFYVDLFGAPWPIPSRYETLGVTNNYAIRLVSPPLACSNNDSICRGEVGLMRYGRFGGPGELKDVNQIAPESKKSYPKGADIITRKYGNLGVRILKEKFGNDRESEQGVIIFNSKEYLFVADDDANLWQCMLTLHQTIKKALKPKD